MAEWVMIDPESLKSRAERSRKTKGGVEVTVFVSPYDVPEAVRGAYNKTNDRFIIEFKYLNDEITRLIKHDDFITFQEGQKSGRLYVIELDIKAIKAKEIILNMQFIDSATKKINALISGIESEKTRRKGFEYYTVLKDVIDNQKDQIFSDLTLSN